MNAKSGLFQRMHHSSDDFLIGVKPALESLLKISIHSIEDEAALGILAKALDQAGIDAFYFTEDRQLRGLASRVRYTEDVRLKPEFSLRFALFDKKANTWSENCEFQKKLRTANSPEQFNFFPKYHVESFANRKAKGTGDIGWSFAAETKRLLNYAEAHIDNPERVRIWEPRSGERRKVISIYADPYALDYEIIPIKSHRCGPATADG